MLQGKEDYLDCDKLYVQYEPLIKSVYNKFSKYDNFCRCHDDYDDLRQQVDFEFFRLCREYCPQKGVDFPGYIKMLLNQRVYHHVMKKQSVQNTEVLLNNKSYDYEEDTEDVMENRFDLVDEDTEHEIERIEAMTSIDWRVIIGKKHRYLVESLLYDNKSLEDIAEEEGVTVKTVRLRLHFICKKLEEWTWYSEIAAEIRNSSLIMVRVAIYDRCPIIVGRQSIQEAV
jgi:RNA polymerase sigma factor (sigma-70 family)